MATFKVATGIRFWPEMHAKISYIAFKEHRSLTGQVEYIVQNYIDEYEKANGEIAVDYDAIEESRSKSKKK